MKLDLIIKYSNLFLFSALVMFIEIIGAKILTPTLGGSQTVWISQILITLLSLAIGGYLSSLLKEDRKFNKIAQHLYISGIVLLICLLFFQNIINIALKFDFIIASLFLSIILYTYSLTSLGMIFPAFYHFIQKEHNQNLGKIYFVGTIGSLFGVLLTYFSVYIATNKELLLFAGLFQIILALQFFEKKNRFRSFGLVLIILLGVHFLSIKKEPAISKNKVLFQENSHFGEVLLVFQNEDKSLNIVNDGILQNRVNDKNQSLSLFTYMIERLPFIYNENIKSTLLLGFGIGGSVNYLNSKNQEISAVEINPLMIDLAKDFFPQNLSNVSLFQADARVFVKQNLRKHPNHKKYDSVILDCFLVDFVPKHLLTQESFTEIKKSLNSKGVLTINSFGLTSPKVDILNSSIYKTLKTVFKEVFIYSLNDWNVYFIAGDDLDPLNLKLNESTFDNIPEAGNIKDKFKALVESPPLQISDTEGIVLTDSSSKIEVLDNVPRELFRRKNNYSIR